LNLKTHEGELAAFITFAKSYPNTYVTLIDSYSSIESGLMNTIIMGKVLAEAGITKIGLRLDSGDLRVQSIKCRQIWNRYFPNGPRISILASDDLHEERLIEI
jgi:nicotinate phosphoribosyltransferase